MQSPDEMKEQTRIFPFCPENKISPQDRFSDYMTEMKPNINTQVKKLIQDCTDKKNDIIHYKMLKFFSRHGKIDDKVHEVISIKQNIWLEKYFSSITLKQIATTNFEKDLFYLPNKAFYEETMKNIKDRQKVEFT